MAGYCPHRVNKRRVTMEKKEPEASREEYEKYVVRYADVPAIELTTGVEANIVSADKITLSFV